MKLYKIKNGKLKEYNGGFVVIDNMIHTNPSEELVRRAGYKTIIEDKEPEFDVKTQYIERVLEDTPDAVLVHYEVKNFEFEEEEK